VVIRGMSFCGQTARWLAHPTWPAFTLHSHSPALCLHEKGQNGTVALDAQPRKIPVGEAADCPWSSVKKRHVTSRVMSRVTKLTPDIRHLRSVSREGSNIRTGAPRPVTSKSDFHLNRTAWQMNCLVTRWPRQEITVNCQREVRAGNAVDGTVSISSSSTQANNDSQSSRSVKSRENDEDR
jgi:hypothetical protein